MNSDPLFISNPALAAALTAVLNNAEHTAINPAGYEQALIDEVADHHHPHTLLSPEEVYALAAAMGAIIDQLGTNSFELGPNSITPKTLGGCDIHQPRKNKTSITPDLLGGWDVRQLPRNSIAYISA